MTGQQITGYPLANPCQFDMQGDKVPTELAGSGSNNTGIITLNEFGVTTARAEN